MAPGKSLEKSGTLKAPPSLDSTLNSTGEKGTSASTGEMGQPVAHAIETHQITWTPYGPIPSHSYVESERIDSLDEWFARCVLLLLSHLALKRAMVPAGLFAGRHTSHTRVSRCCPPTAHAYGLPVPAIRADLDVPRACSGSMRTQSGRRRGG
jgi:hypothetical protein